MPEKKRKKDHPAFARLSKGKLWLFRFTSMFIIPLLLILFLEFVLRFSGYGYHTTFFVKNNRDGYLNHNNKFTCQFFPPGLQREPSPVLMSREKSPDTCRIFVFGESAALGDPKLAFSFSRILDVMLEEKYPDGTFEVINTGITAINSNVILPIARECAKYKPDLYIIYAGNNEAVGPFSPSASFTPYMSDLNAIRGSILVRSTRTGQLISRIGNKLLNTDKILSEWGGMSMFMRTKLAFDDERLETIYNNFRVNMQDIINAGLDAGADVLLCTVGTNLKDCPPFASMNNTSLSTAQINTFQKYYKEGIDCFKNGDYNWALDKFEQALKIDDSYAELNYSLGELYLNSGRKKQALDAFTRARDMDVLRFRADTGINNVIRELAIHFEDKIYFSDIENAFIKYSTDGIPGDEYFLEHVHMNFTGNYFIAQQLMKQIELIIGKPGQNPLMPVKKCKQLLGYSDYEQFDLLRMTIDRLKTAPFTNQKDNQQDVCAMESDLNLLQNHLKDSFKILEADALYSKALANRPDDYILMRTYAFWLLQIKNSEFQNKAVHLLDKLAKMFPEDHVTLTALGLAHFNLKNFDTAIKYFDLALKLEPNDSTALKYKNKIVTVMP